MTEASAVHTVSMTRSCVLLDGFVVFLGDAYQLTLGRQRELHGEGAGEPAARAVVADVAREAQEE